MSEIEVNSNNFDEEQDGQRFTIQPYQFEPRINSDAAELTQTMKAARATKIWREVRMKTQILDRKIQTGM